MTETFTEKARSLDEQAYLALKTALELGKWPTGDRLTAEQKEICMQTIISYEVQNLPEEQRTGYMEQACSSQSADKIDSVQQD
ncbi:hypothetical protein imdm_2239 [gamma proteobacterium IMCC2047]|nr:hypothetical protein imdm_2239 [gamma proteobacterium IMCC2047]